MAAPPPGVRIKANNDAVPIPGNTDFDLETVGCPATNNIAWTLPANLVAGGGGFTANKSKITVSAPPGTYLVKCVASLFTATGEGNYSHDMELTVVVGPVPAQNPNPLPPIND